MDATKGGLVVYPTCQGKTAAYGEGRKGIFTKHLLKNLGEDEVKAMINRIGFFDKDWNKSRGFQNNFESRVIDGDRVVCDHATGLGWHQSGSEKQMTYNNVRQWINELNR
jgi:hypothetical protein